MLYLGIEKNIITNKDCNKKTVIYTSYDSVIESEIDKCLDKSSLIVCGTVGKKIGTKIIPVISEEEYIRLLDEEKIYYQDLVCEYSFEIKDILKGTCDTKKIVYNVIGGKDDEFEQVILEDDGNSGINNALKEGHEYILFLKEDKYGGYSTYSMVQGRIEIISTDDGKKMIHTNDPIFKECNSVEDVKNKIDNAISNGQKERIE